MKNLYLISSPFQALCATEAKEYFQLRNNVALIVNYSNDSDRNLKQIENIMALSQWDEIITIGKQSNTSKYREYIVRLFKLKRDKYKNIFIGHFGQFQHVLLSNLDYQKVYVIDDGVLTLELHKNELNPFRKKHPIKFSKQLKNLRYRLFGFDVEFDKRKLNYFTLFKLEQYYGEEIITNNFHFLKKYINEKAQDIKVVYFLGQPLIGDVVSRESYIKNLTSVQQYFKNQGKKTVYIPHRRESKDLKYIEEMEGEYFSIKRPHNIIELFLLEENLLPYGVYSFFSTAIFSLKAIYNDKIEIAAFEIKNDELLHNHNKIKNIYTTMKDNNISVLSV